MLDATERREIAGRFQAADEQVVRDHLISHVLSVLPSLDQDLVFYGGTALARTHLPGFRLSEDIDLLARDRAAAVSALEKALPRALRREFGDVRWLVGPSRVNSEAAPAFLSTEDGIQVVAQLREVVGRAVFPAAFVSMPESTRAGWSVQLDHQMAVTPDPDQCLTEVRDAWAVAFTS